MLPEEFGAEAIASAGAIFEHGRRACVLAHSVQATEAFICEHRKIKAYSIKVDVKRGIQAFHGARAVVFQKEHSAEIWVESDIDIESQRMAVAHELGHIILGIKMIGRGLGLPRRAESEHEQWCRDFEKHLCMLLHFLYTETDYVEHTRFPSMAEACRLNIDTIKRFMRM